MKELVLPQNKIGVIDEADYELVSQQHWSVQRVANHWYVFATINGERIYLHRFLLQCSPSERVKHIDGDPLNNQRSNLEIVRDGYLGVSYVERGKKHWKAMIRFDGKQEYLGVFDTAEEAAWARDQAAIEAWGIQAKLNFPELQE